MTPWDQVGHRGEKEIDGGGGGGDDYDDNGIEVGVVSL